MVPTSAPVRGGIKNADDDTTADEGGTGAVAARSASEAPRRGQVGPQRLRPRAQGAPPESLEARADEHRVRRPPGAGPEDGAAGGREVGPEAAEVEDPAGEL